ncbi:MAG: phenylalanine--tRNA ligase subunit alpha, partial [Lachnospiraceae bacterium]|nr:phenylalanine--tRNA ligase subunit alpha [Lachnospiraceae bacterium]
MNDKLREIKEKAIKQIAESEDLNRLNDARVEFLGKKGELSQMLKSMKELTEEERPKFGQLVNETRRAIEDFLEETRKKLENKELSLKLEKEVIDVTLPAKKINVGAKHPCTLALEEVERIFSG